MRIRITPVVTLTCGLALALIAAACDDQPTSPPQPGEEAATEVAANQGQNADLEGKINRLIGAIYPPGQLKRDANKAFADIKSALARGDSQAARSRMFEFVDGLLEAARAGELRDPTGQGIGASTAREGAAELTRIYFEFLGLEAPPITAGALEESGAADVVGPDQGAQVKTGDGKGGVNIPPGRLEEAALVTMERHEDPETVGDAPIPQNLELAPHPPFYDVETTTQPTDDGVLVGVCVPTSGPLAPEADLQDDLRMVRQADGGSAPEFLPAASADFVDCGSDEVAVAGMTTGFSGFGAGSSPDVELVENAPSLTCALRTDGQTFCWGRHDIYLGSGGNLVRLGNDTIPGIYRTTPVPVMQDGVSYDTLAAGSDHVCALDESSGQAYCWGANGAGQLGTGDFDGSATPRQVTGSHSFESISAGFYSTCAQTSNETYC
jgi:hypothetical protein